MLCCAVLYLTVMTCGAHAHTRSGRGTAIIANSNSQDGSSSRALRPAYRIGGLCAVDRRRENRFCGPTFAGMLGCRGSELADPGKRCSAVHDMVGQSSQARETIKSMNDDAVQGSSDRATGMNHECGSWQPRIVSPLREAPLPLLVMLDRDTPRR